MRRIACTGLLCVGLGSGCYSGVSGHADWDPSAGMGGDTAADGDAGESGDADDGSTDDGGADDGEPQLPPDGQCEWNDGLPNLQMRRLTRLEYDNSVRDLFGITSQPALAFVDDSPAGGFDANDLAVSELQARLYVDVAETVAAEIVAAPTTLTDCDLGEQVCVDTFVQTWGRRVFRRDLTSEEVADYRSFFEEMRDAEGVDAALTHTLAAWLASPNFLYIAQRDAPDEPHAQAYAQASRLAYFLWASTPDEALLDRAAAGQLEELDSLDAVVREMLDDPRADQSLSTFTQQWLQVESLAYGAGGKDSELYPQWDEQLASQMDAELQALFVDVVLEGNGTLNELLTTRRAYVSEALASVYGVDAPAGGEGWVELPEGERAGLLTRAGFLAAHAHEREGSVVLRGVVVQRQFLCGELPPPPDDIDLDPEVNRVESPQCAGCHVLIDPIGEGLHEYDAIGQWNDIPSEGTLVGAEDSPFEGGAELTALLADSERVQRCMARQWFQFSHPRAIAYADACTLELVEQAVIDSGGDIREAIVAVATSDSFRFGIDS